MTPIDEGAADLQRMGTELARRLEESTRRAWLVSIAAGSDGILIDVPPVRRRLASNEWADRYDIEIANLLSEGHADDVRLLGGRRARWVVSMVLVRADHLPALLGRLATLRFPPPRPIILSSGSEDHDPDLLDFEIHELARAFGFSGVNDKNHDEVFRTFDQHAPHDPEVIWFARLWLHLTERMATYFQGRSRTVGLDDDYDDSMRFACTLRHAAKKLWTEMKLLPSGRAPRVGPARTEEVRRADHADRDGAAEQLMDMVLLGIPFDRQERVLAPILKRIAEQKAWLEDRSNNDA